MDNLLEHFRDVMSAAPAERAVSPRSAAATAPGPLAHLAHSAPSANSANSNHSANSLNSGSDENAQLIRLLDEVTHSICRDDDAEAPAGRGGGGFVVEEPPLARAKSFPPVYGAAANFAFAKPPPPSFAEAIATTPPLTNATARAELSTLAARYVPPMPAAQQDTIIVRNEQGVFLLQSITKPTPPYTPPNVSPPISPLPRYALPPAAQPQPHFLGSSVALAAEPEKARASPPSPSIGSARAFTFSSAAVNAGYTPPPPYPN